jgi:hypothetical protein
MHNLAFSKCRECKGKHRDNTSKTAWLLDSGANRHFTYRRDNFVDYTELEQPETLHTANSTSRIIGEGTIVIRVPNLDGSYRPVTIHGVRHCPDINVNLLSLGTFLCKEGMSVSGSSDQMVLRLHGKPYLVFTPTKPGATLFGVIRALLV